MRNVHLLSPQPPSETLMRLMAMTYVPVVHHEEVVGHEHLSPEEIRVFCKRCKSDTVVKPGDVAVVKHVDGCRLQDRIILAERAWLN